MKKLRAALGLFMLPFAVASFGQTPATPPPASLDAEAAINQLRQGLVDSFFKGDIDRVLAFLAPDVVVTWQNGEVNKGPEQVRAYYNRMMTGDNRVVREIKAQPEVLGRQINGDWAISWGKLHDQFVLSDGRELKLDSVFTITTAKRGDRWLVTSYHASVNAFENAILKEAIQKVVMWAVIGGAVIGLLIGGLIGRRKRAGSPA